ncbi:sporulation protein YunB [Alicyclobacillus ferrooxydans]|uniref:Sporulation protein YunB n=1 Tax=Alicyclobacillus ferrooxydans TaxID=471514 RepID=A0A0P9CZ29_9BACL|nr:sporulation protein YunB [Alicyclobacillus ferrooxydans]KPV42260.1 hypothetical protein AN477_18290 [Alicyclobacillus ferrooxydans]
MPQTFRPRRSRGSRSSGASIEWESQTPSGPRRRYLGIKISGGIFAVVLLLVILIDTRVRPSIAAIADTVARRAATEAMNDALQSAISHSPDTGKMLHVATDREGNVRMTSFDFHAVSILQAEVTKESEETLGALSRETFPLPIGQTLGGALLSPFSPELPVRIHLVGSAHSSIHMEVKSIGINQSVHALYLNVDAEVQAVAPLVTKPVEVQTSVPLAYVVLNGEIPSTYVAKGDGALPVLPPAKSP